MTDHLTDTNVGNIEYIRREDAIDLINKISNLDLKAKGGICVSLANLQKADVVQVVRCKDCKHFYFADNRISQEQRYVCEISGEIWKPDSFCSCGERREE